MDRKPDEALSLLSPYYSEEVLEDAIVSTSGSAVNTKVQPHFVNAELADSVKARVYFHLGKTLR